MNHIPPLKQMYFLLILTSFRVDEMSNWRLLNGFSGNGSLLKTIVDNHSLLFRNDTSAKSTDFAKQ